MNSNFNGEQIKAYAAVFEEGDAIWCDDEWWEVSKLTGISGFKEEENPYRVTTLADYELQGGEKLVWLGEGGYIFGEVFGTFVDENGKVVYTGDSGFVLPASSKWAVIPRYEQVKSSIDSTKKKPKFKVGDKVTVADKFTGVIEIVGNEPYVYGVRVEGEDGEKRLNNYWESDLGLYEVEKVEGRPASSHYHNNNNGNDVWNFADDNLSDERVKGFHQINAIKYVSRYHKKHDTIEKRIEDLEKAKVSIDKLIELEKKG